MRKRRDAGFTLIEGFVVLIILGILAAIAIPVFVSQKQKERERRETPKLSWTVIGGDPDGNQIKVACNGTSLLTYYRDDLKTTEGSPHCTTGTYDRYATAEPTRSPSGYGY